MYKDLFHSYRLQMFPMFLSLWRIEYRILQIHLSVKLKLFCGVRLFRITEYFGLSSLPGMCKNYSHSCEKKKKTFCYIVDVLRKRISTFIRFLIHFLLVETF